MENFSTATLVAAVALLDENGMVLMQKRPEQSMHGGLWEFPGGKVEFSETVRDAAVREISEELGLTIDPAELDPLTFAAGPTVGPGGGELVILLYTCRRWQGVPQCRGADAVSWFEVGRLAGLDMPPLDYPLARGLATLVGAATD